MTLDGRTIAQVEQAVAGDQAAMPLAERLSRRLGAASWLIRLDEAGRLRGVTVLKTPAAPEPSRSETASPLPEPGSPLDRAYPLAADGVLARLVGGPTATGRQLADLALRQDDPQVRGEAVRVAVDAMMRDPALEQTLLGTLDGVDDRHLANLVASAGAGASGLLSVVVERARGRPLGQRAAALLAHLAVR